ncbi:MAG: CDP-alcohol phosphatidyltransferase family protein [Adlercreutzia mucosicola]|nr:CDP-alcohol phosphatidyltransferase family protein [Adlercreutzia mucosicola]
MAEKLKNASGATEEVTHRIFTLANIISFVRLLMVPAYLVLLLNGYDLAATLVFAVAAATDFLDGQIARRTHTVSRLGQLLDPAIDRILMITGVLGVFIVGRIPLWVIIVVVVRDLYLLIGGGILLSRFRIRVPVIYPGKFATTFLFVGFAGLLLNWPLVPGLGLTDAAWLPGFSDGMVSWGIWFIYAGLILSLGVTVYYSVAAARALKQALADDPKRCGHGAA